VTLKVKDITRALCPRLPGLELIADYLELAGHAGDHDGAGTDLLCDE